MNSISALLTRRNLEILELISQQSLALREIAEQLKCSPGKVHQAIAVFKGFEIIKTERKKGRLIISPNKENPLYQKIKALININKILNARTYSKIAKIGICGVYGSYSRGTDDAESDIDLLIVTGKKELGLRDDIRSLENELNKKINPLIMTEQKLKMLEQQDKEFFIRLKLTMTQLNGEIFG